MAMLLQFILVFSGARQQLPQITREHWFEVADTTISYNQSNAISFFKTDLSFYFMKKDGE